MVAIRPTADRILIRRVAQPEQRHGSLILPALPAEAPMVCEVLAVGPGKKSEKTGVRIPIALSVGDQVLIGRWAGTDVEVNGETFRLLGVDEVIGTIEGDGTLTVME